MSIFGVWGFDFLYLYLGVALVAWFASTRLVRAIRPRGSAPSRELHLYERITLCSGSHALTHAVVARLVQEKRLRITDDGKFAPGPKLSAAPDEADGERGYRGAGLAADSPALVAARTLEERILESVADRPSSIKNLVWVSGSAAQAFQGPLVDEGLLLSEAATSRSHIAKWLVMLLVFAFGAVKVVLGYFQGDGVLLLIVLVLLAALVLSVAVPIPRTTPRGEELVKQLSTRHFELIPQLRANPERLSPHDLALGVGLYGAATLGDTELGRALAPAP